MPLLLLGCFGFSVASASCPPSGQTPAALRSLASAGFAIEDSAGRQQLALSLLDCLEHRDPVLRDEVAYTGLSTWLRGGLLDPATVDALRQRVVGQLRADDDALGLRHSFAALTLAELARVDRIEPVYSDSEFAELLGVAIGYLRTIDDYRDYDPQIGWRHQVAHGSDLVLQLALNPRIDGTSMASLFDALALQIAPAGVAYTAGEPQRIARAVHYAQQRETLDSSWWQAWMLRAVPPAADPAVPLTTERLATRHNEIAFLLALHYAATAAANPPGAELQSLVTEAMQRVD